MIVHPIQEKPYSSVVENIPYPNMYFRGHQTSGNECLDAGAANSIGEDIPLFSTGVIGTTWTANPGWITGQGNQLDHFAALDVTAVDNFCRLDTLVGGHLIVSGWYQTADVVAASATGLTAYGGGYDDGNKPGWRVYTTATTPEICCEVDLADAARTRILGATTLTADTPAHFLMDMQVSSGQVDFALYHNGAQVGTETVSGTLFGAISGIANGGFHIGARNGGGDYMETDEQISDLLYLRVPTDVSAKVSTLAQHLYRAGRTDLPAYLAESF